MKKRLLVLSVGIFVALADVLLRSAVAQADPPEAVNLRKTVVVQVVSETKSAVVNISTTKMIREFVSPFGNDPMFQQFGRFEEDVPGNSLGSGFIIHKDGYVVTNNHVVDRATTITVELADGRKLPAELINVDAKADLALVKIEDKQPFPTISLGDSSDLMIGEPAIAIGNPLGYSHSVSSGIISALHRDLKDVEEKETLDNLIQTDAAINPGNSGGPLLNAYGQVIGINTAIRSDAQNIGFAIPVNRLRDLIPELMNPAQVRNLDIPLKLREVRSITPPANVHVDVVTEDGAHTVREINGTPIHNLIDAYDVLLSAKQSEKIIVGFTDGHSEEIACKSIAMPDVVAQAKAILGITVAQLNPMLAEKYHLDQQQGILVTGVDPESPCGRAQVQPGDIVIVLWQFPISTLDDLAEALGRLPQSGRVPIVVIRENQAAKGFLVLGENDKT